MAQNPSEMLVSFGRVLAEPQRGRMPELAGRSERRDAIGTPKEGVMIGIYQFRLSSALRPIDD
jgi:hypothetical protein